MISCSVSISGVRSLGCRQLAVVSLAYHRTVACIVLATQRRLVVVEGNVVKPYRCILACLCRRVAIRG